MSNLYFQTGKCQFIYGDLKEGTGYFCSHDHLAQKVYCAEHQALCYTGKRIKDVKPSGIEIPLQKWRSAKAHEAALKVMGKK